MDEILSNTPNALASLIREGMEAGREEDETREKSSIRMISLTVTTTTQLVFFREEVRFRLKM